MRLKKSLVYLFLLVFLVGVSPSWADSTVTDPDDYKYDRLRKMASGKGYARVIIKMDVPDIEPLTAMSTSYRTGAMFQPFSQEAFNADLGLELAVAGAADGVLHHLNGTNYKINHRFTSTPFLALTVSPEALERLRTAPEVTDVFEDRRVRLPAPTATENGEEGTSEPMLGDSTTIVGADAAWGFGYDGAGWYVAVLDTGLRTDHEMFLGKNIVEQCFASGGDGLIDTPGSCPNGLSEMSGPGSAAPFNNFYSHGTHVAGIVAGNNGVDRFGVARGAGIIAVNVFSYFPSEGGVSAWNSDIGRGLDYVYSLRNTYPIAAVNLSLGGDIRYDTYCHDFWETVMNNLKAAGIATVAASGNEYYCDAVGNPACIESVVTVNATHKDDLVFGQGNWDNTMVDLLAPGVSIESAVSPATNAYGFKTGTSMAAPHVAGAWAVLKQLDPNLSVDEILAALQQNGAMLTSSRCEGTVPKARINVRNALFSLFSIAPPTNLSARQENNRSFLQEEYLNELTWEANPANADKNITRYRVYTVNGENLTLLAEVDSSTFMYWHRNAGKRRETTYAVTAVDADGQEGPPRYFTIEFGLST